MFKAGSGAFHPLEPLPPQVTFAAALLEQARVPLDVYNSSRLLVWEAQKALGFTPQKEGYLKGMSSRR